MPINDPFHEDAHNRHEARLRPDAAEVMRVRALLTEIERRVFSSAAPPDAATHDSVAGTVARLFGDG